MIYYKDKNGEVFAYETEQERNEWGAPDLVELTKKQLEAHLNPKPTVEQLTQEARYKRDSALQDVLWIVDRHNQQIQIGIEPTLTEEQYTDLLTYIQALRDYPQQPDYWLKELPECPL